MININELCDFRGLESTKCEVFSLKPKNEHIIFSMIDDFLGEQIGQIMSSIVKMAVFNAVGKTCTVSKYGGDFWGNRFIKFGKDEYDFETGYSVVTDHTYNNSGMNSSILFRNPKTGYFHVLQIFTHGSSRHRSTITIKTNKAVDIIKISNGPYTMLVDSNMYSFNSYIFQETFEKYDKGTMKYLYSRDHGKLVCNDIGLERVVNTFIKVFISSLEDCLIILEQNFGDPVKNYNHLYGELGNSIINLTPLQVERLGYLCVKPYHESNDKIFVEKYISSLHFEDISSHLNNAGMASKRVKELTDYFTGTLGEFCTEYNINTVTKIPGIGKMSAEIIDRVIRGISANIMKL